MILGMMCFSDFGEESQEKIILVWGEKKHEHIPRCKLWTLSNFPFLHDIEEMNSTIPSRSTKDCEIDRNGGVEVAAHFDWFLKSGSSLHAPFNGWEEDEITIPKERPLLVRAIMSQNGFMRRVLFTLTLRVRFADEGNGRGGYDAGRSPEYIG